MDKELLKLLEEATRKELTEDDKKEFLEGASEMVKGAKKGCIVITDKGVTTMGRGIDIMTILFAGITDLRLNRIKDDDMWRKLFEDSMKIKNDNLTENDEDEKVNELLEKLGSLNELLEKMKKQED